MKKPTKEELDAQLAETIRKADEEKVQEEKEVKEVIDDIPQVDEVVEETSQEDEEIIEEKASEEVEPSEPVPSPDYKEKFSNSSRENQKIYAKNRKINEAVAKAAGITEVDQAELQAEYPDWDVMSETEQKLAKDNFINKKRFELVAQATEEAKKIEKWSEDVAAYIQDPKVLAFNPKLEGKEKEFIEYANQLENHSIPFKVLTSAFLHDMENQKPAKQKGKMMETGTGGPNTKPKLSGGKITVEQAAILMKNDYKKYKELLIAGKIDMSSIQ